MKTHSIKSKILFAMVLPILIIMGGYFYGINAYQSIGDSLKPSTESATSTEGNASVEETVKSKKINLLFLSALMCGVLLISGLVLANIVSGDVKKVSARMVDIAGEYKSIGKNMTSNNQELNESVAGQSSSLNSTVTAIEEISSMVEKSAEAAKQATRVSLLSKEAAEGGKNAVGEMISEINEISKTNSHIVSEMDRSNTEVSKIVDMINEIGSKTRVINDIVFQTKLLSFNASVEAARAGEHGKGFAVVAEEVGNLAAMSGTAATEITELLGSSVKQVKNIVNSSKSQLENLAKIGKAKVESGISVAKICDEALDEILGNVNSVNEMTKEIAVATSEQSAGVAEVNRAMQELDNTTHKNTLLAKQSVEMAQGLTSHSNNFSDLIDEFYRDSFGDRSGRSMHKNYISSNDSNPQTASSGLATRTGSSNVIDLATKRKEKADQAQAGQATNFSITDHEPKKVVNANSGGPDIPDFDDPRFEDL